VGFFVGGSFSAAFFISSTAASNPHFSHEFAAPAAVQRDQSGVRRLAAAFLPSSPAATPWFLLAQSTNQAKFFTINTYENASKTRL